MVYALSDIKVLDVTQYVAGPYCTKLLADFGAEVIKVEKPWGGDGARKSPPFLGDEPGEERSGLFFYLNTNKKSITLNLKTGKGRGILSELVARADIVVESFSPRVASSLGLSYEALRAVKDDIILASISNFGQSGPYKDYKASEIVLEALGGSLYTLGPPEKPVKFGGFQGQYMAGSIAFTAALGALFSGMKSGDGQHIDISIMECLASYWTAAATIPYSYMGLIYKRGFYERFHLGHPVGIYKCKDGYVLVMPGYGGISNIPLLIDRPELIDHPWFTDHIARQAHAEEFDAEFLLPWLEEHTKEEIVEKAQELRMPFAVVATTSELFQDPQLKAREFFASVEHPVLGQVSYPGPPAKMANIAWRKGCAPLLGGHNEEIYGGLLDYSKEDLVRLREGNII